MRCVQKEKVRLGTIRMAMAAIKQKEIDETNYARRQRNLSGTDQNG